MPYGITKGTVRLGGVEFIDGDNCTITFGTDTNPNDQLIINFADPLYGDVYYGLNISGFRDAAGKSIRFKSAYFSYISH